MPYLWRWDVFTSMWCHFGCGDLLSFLDACIMPCVLDARLALLSFGVVVRVFSRTWNEYGTLCIYSCAGLVERVFLYHYVCSFVTSCGSSNMNWSLLLTCRVDVIWRGYVWFLERVNAAVGCSVVSLTSWWLLYGSRWRSIMGLTVRPMIEEVYKGFWWGNLKEKDHSKDTDVDRRIILRWIFRKWDGRHGLDWSGSEYREVAGTCKGANEPSGSIKCGEFLY